MNQTKSSINLKQKYLSIFYNKETLQDTLVSRLSNITPNVNINLVVVKKSDTILFYDSKQQLLGFNILNASNKNLNIIDGLNYPSKNLIEKINQIIGLDLNSFIDKIPFVVGKIKTITPILKTHLNYCEIDINKDSLQKVICGATNVRENLKIVLALPGAILNNGKEINTSTISGYESHGMICSANELGLKQLTPKKTILELNDMYIVGEHFIDIYKKEKKE